MFLVFSGLRALAAAELLHYVLSLETIVDLMTLPPLFLAAITQRQWIGFRHHSILLTLISIPSSTPTSHHLTSPGAGSCGLRGSSAYPTCSSS